MRRIFWGFWRKWFLKDPLHYLLSCSDFGFKLAEIFVIQKQLPDSANRRVGDSPTRRVGELATLRLGESRSCRLSDSASRGVDDSPTLQIGESVFECSKENSVSRRVCNSPTRWVGESLWWVGELLFKFFKIFHHFKGLNQPGKRSIWQKRSQVCHVLLPLIYLKVWKKLYL